LVSVAEKDEEVKIVPRNAQQMWTDDDLATLAKYIKKFPGGTTDRLEADQIFFTINKVFLGIL